MTLRSQALAVLSGFDHDDPAQNSLALEYRTFLADHPDGVFRSCRPGHITASAVVLDARGENVLLTLHPKVGRWLQLGGHLELQDASVRDAAAREVREESGIARGWIGARPLRLDRHPVPCGRDEQGHPLASEHLDIQYLVVVPEVTPVVISEESDDLRWFGLGALPEIDVSVRSLLDDAIAHLGGQEVFPGTTMVTLR